MAARCRHWLVRRLNGGYMKDSAMMTNSRRTYLPAAGRDRFLPLYDLMTKLMAADQARRGLLDQAQIRPRHGILDIGCGTCTFLIQLKSCSPRTAVA